VWTGREAIAWGGVGPSRGVVRGSEFPAPGTVLNDGARYRPYWLAVASPTPAQSLADELVYVAQPGQRYRVGLIEEGWALVQQEGASASQQVWIALDDRVAIGTP